MRSSAPPSAARRPRSARALLPPARARPAGRRLVSATAVRCPCKHRHMVELRDATPADAGAIAILLVQSWRAAYRGLILDDVLADLSVPTREVLVGHPHRPRGAHAHRRRGHRRRHRRFRRYRAALRPRRPRRPHPRRPLRALPRSRSWGRGIGTHSTLPRWTASDPAASPMRACGSSTPTSARYASTPPRLDRHRTHPVDRGPAASSYPSGDSIATCSTAEHEPRTSGLRPHPAPFGDQAERPGDGGDHLAARPEGSQTGWLGRKAEKRALPPHHPARQGSTRAARRSPPGTDPYGGGAAVSPVLRDRYGTGEPLGRRPRR